MPNFITPRAEGERMDMVEMMVEKSRQEFEYRVLNNPAELAIRVGEWLTNLGLSASWSAQQAARADASFTDLNIAAGHAERLREFGEAFDELFLTDAGRVAWARFIDDNANRRAASGA